MYLPTAPGSGTDVNHSSHSLPSDAAATRPSWCSVESGSRRMPSRSSVTGFGWITCHSCLPAVASAKAGHLFKVQQRHAAERLSTDVPVTALAIEVPGARRQVIRIETNRIGGNRSRDDQRFVQQRAADAATLPIGRDRPVDQVDRLVAR